MKFKKWLGCLLALVMMFSMNIAFAACDDTPTPSGDTVTITWYDGRTVLHTAEVEKGSVVKADDFTATKDGFDFRGWFTDSSLAVPFKDGMIAEKDVNLFSQWRTQNPEPDNRMWYMRGSSMGQKWTQLTAYNKTKGEWYKSQDETFEKFFFQKVEGKENTFTIELEVRYGEKFRFVTNMYNEDWTGDEGCAQLGLGNLVGFAFAAGTNPEKGSKVDSADLYLYGEVKNDKGEVVFNGGYEYNMPSYTWNIWPTKGHGGVYRFTFQSFPGTDATDEVEWEFVKMFEHDFEDADKDGVCDQCGVQESAEHKHKYKDIAPADGMCDYCGKSKEECQSA